MSGASTRIVLPASHSLHCMLNASYRAQEASQREKSCCPFLFGGRKFISSLWTRFLQRTSCSLPSQRLNLSLDNWRQTKNQISLNQFYLANLISQLNREPELWCASKTFSPKASLVLSKFSCIPNYSVQMQKLDREKKTDRKKMIHMNYGAEGEHYEYSRPLEKWTSGFQSKLSVKHC